MNTLTNYWKTTPFIDWNKEARDILIPTAASLGVGALVNYNHPTAFAVCFIARQLFLNPWNCCVPTIDAGLSKLTHRLFPDDETKANTALQVYSLVVSTAITHAVGYKIAECAGYHIAPIAWLWGSLLGAGAYAYVQQKLNEDPFQESEILTVAKDNFQQEVIESDLPVVIDAYSNLCPPCRAMIPIFSELREELSGKVKFVKFNVDQDRELAKQLDIQAMPTFLFFKDGKAVDSHSGAMSKGAFQSGIDKAFF